MTNYVEETLRYYDRHVRDFVDDTLDLDMSSMYRVFEKYIDAGGAILDLGCGHGRDVRHFISEGYHVTGIDGSRRMCDYASEYTGQHIQCKKFSELEYYECFDGVWASASLLHVAKKDLPDILKKIHRALRPGGYLFLSLKRGGFEGMRDEKYYSDYTEQEFFQLIEQCGGFAIAEYVNSEDQREDNKTQWINVVLRRN
ncbi:MAG: class I SAM-dependent methyltransferase [Anaerovoracaceae bacterium]|jgi:SAM-dependent methyltransferase